MAKRPIVLVIDDNKFDRTLLSKLLSDHCDIEVAESGMAGLQLATEIRPDLILLDVMMPGWDGFETCRHIKREAGLEHIPILFLSALDNREDKVLGFQAGGVDYVCKPYEKSELLARVRAHVELAYLRGHLEREVALKTRKVEMLNEALQLSFDRVQQASMLKTEFLSNVSHEFRTPMNIIIGMADALQDDAQLSETARRRIHSVSKAADQLMSILDNMLAFANHYKGDLEQRTSFIRIPDLIESVLEHQIEMAKQQQIQVHRDTSEALDEAVEINREGTSQVLEKLLENAIKFTPAQGQVGIFARCAQGEGERWFARLEVQDSGPGIEPEKRERIFDAFVQGDGSSTRRVGGVGMGLAVAKMLTEAMGGEIGLETPREGGSLFWFQVPVVRQAQGQQNASLSSA